MRWLAAFLFFSGLCLAGSDGPYFPFINCAGVGLLLVLAALAPGDRPSGIGTSFEAKR